MNETPYEIDRCYFNELETFMIQLSNGEALFVPSEDKIDEYLLINNCAIISSNIAKKPLRVVDEILMPIGDVPIAYHIKYETRSN